MTRPHCEILQLNFLNFNTNNFSKLLIQFRCIQWKQPFITTVVVEYNVRQVKLSAGRRIDTAGGVFTPFEVVPPREIHFPSNPTVIVYLTVRETALILSGYPEEDISQVARLLKGYLVYKSLKYRVERSNLFSW